MKRKIYLFDAERKVLGRMAVEIANALSGRKKADFVPNIDSGGTVVVVNSDEVTVTGNKSKNKMYHHFSGYPGGVKSFTFEEMMEKDSRKVIQAAVYGMLPKNKLRDKMMKRLKVFKKSKHDYKPDLVA